MNKKRTNNQRIASEYLDLKNQSKQKKIDEKREKHERREKKEKSRDKKRVKLKKKKDENQEREIQSLFMREKEVNRVMLARQPMYLPIPHDYCLSSIASSLLGMSFPKTPLMGYLL